MSDEPSNENADFDATNSTDITSADTASADALPTDDPAATLLELDEVFAALGHPRRRYLLYTLIKGSDEETLPELATKIAAWEQDTPTADVTSEKRMRVQASLYHSHVPKLANLGVLAYDRGEDIIVRAQNTDQVQAVLDGAGAELDARQESHARDEEVR